MEKLSDNPTDDEDKVRYSVVAGYLLRVGSFLLLQGSTDRFNASLDNLVRIPTGIPTATVSAYAPGLLADGKFAFPLDEVSLHQDLARMVWSVPSSFVPATAPST